MITGTRMSSSVTSVMTSEKDPHQRVDDKPELPYPRRNGDEMLVRRRDPETPLGSPRRAQRLAPQDSLTHRCDAKSSAGHLAAGRSAAATASRNRALRSSQVPVAEGSDTWQT